MNLRHILAATDESDAGRGAVRAAADLAGRSSAQLTVLQVIPVERGTRLVGVGPGLSTTDVQGKLEVERLRRWLAGGVLPSHFLTRVRQNVAFGIPGIEICRYADIHNVDLVVLGRKPHSPLMRLLLGDTADAVARRNRCPTLIIPQTRGRIERVLVALDGSSRGLNVLRAACDFARQAQATLHAVIIERAPANEPADAGHSVPLAASAALRDRVGEELVRHQLPDDPLTILRGDIVESILAEAGESEADALVIGYHRGGPPGVLEAGSIARRVAHLAPCAVLTIPL